MGRREGGREGGDGGLEWRERSRRHTTKGWSTRVSLTETETPNAVHKAKGITHPSIARGREAAQKEKASARRFSFHERTKQSWVIVDQTHIRNVSKAASIKNNMIYIKN